MMDATPSSGTKLQAIVALNNTGVSLLRRHLFRQALDTFTDAMKLFHASFSSSAEICCDSSEGFDQAMQNARQRLSLPSPAQLSCPRVVVVSNEDNPSTVYTTLLDERPSNKIFFCIAMDSVDCEEKRSLDLKAAILLFNTGAASSCLSTRATSNGARGIGKSKLANNALCFFRFAEQLLSQLFTMIADSNVDIVMSQLLLLAMLLQHSVLASSWRLGLSDDDPSEEPSSETLAAKVTSIMEQARLLPRGTPHAAMA
jgi:hypothetical protein